MNGNDLLNDFRCHRSEAAFAELVRRYTNLVYSVARRRLSDDALAQEATQTVFIRLARSEATPDDESGLVGWLHRTAVHVSIDLWRSESRRRTREHQAATMRTEPSESAAWEMLGPVLDEALHELASADRQALLLRFFEGQSMRELGGTLGISEDAAKMRVSRALERLREQLKGNGIACSAVALGTLLVDRAVEAAPVGLADRLAGLDWKTTAASSGGAVAVGWWTQLAGLLPAKLVPGSILALLGLGVVLLAVRPSSRGPRSHPDTAVVADPARIEAPSIASSTATTGASTSGASSMDPAAPLPDPLGLLQGVARARASIESGSLEIQLTSERRYNGHRETAPLRLACRFDGAKRLWEQVGKEYRYTAMMPDSEEQEARIRREKLDRATAIREKLLEEFEARYVTVFDGAALTTYRETDGKPAGTTIDDATKGSSEYVFDPRGLGLPGFLWMGGSLEDCLGHTEAKAIELVGREARGAGVAWHVRVRTRHEDTRDYWIDVAVPTRVLECSGEGYRVVSSFEGAPAGSPIPSEILFTETRAGAEPSSRRLVVSRARFNHPVEPSTFTLAGLGMPVGTEVIDVRNHRIIGAWNGVALVDHGDAPSAATGPGAADSGPTLETMRSVLELDPTSSAGLDAALWILLHTPDGSEVELAAEVVGREHARVRHPRLGELCRALEERLRHRCSTNLLRTLLRENPDPEIQVAACYSLAVLYKEAAAFGRNAEARTEAIGLFERVIREFKAKGRVGAHLAWKAEPELHELRHLSLGQVVPPTQGLDLEGNALDLAAYRGQVVVLLFWSGNTQPGEVYEFYRLQEKYAGCPLAIVGVHCDDDLKRARRAVEQRIIRWPSFHDTRSGPIAKAWNVHSWPTRIVIDAQGRLHYRSGVDRDLEAAVARLFPADPGSATAP